jgi:hypothetical protein
VLMLEVLEHVQHVHLALAEIHRVLRPTGRCCIAVPTYWSERLFSWLHPDWFRNSKHVHVFRESALLEALTEVGLSPVRITPKNSIWAAFWLLHSLWRTDFHFTGVPKENHLLTRAFWGVWRRLCRFGIGWSLERVGDRLFPKSLYIYCAKTPLPGNMPPE